MVEKNEELIVKIDAYGSEGEGIGRIDGYALFVKDAVIGDTVKVKVMKAKKNYAFARLVEIITPSEDRIDPPCTLARKCGGCQIQHINYEKQLEFKHNKVKNCLEHIGGFKVVEQGTVETDVDAVDNVVVMEPALGMDNAFYYRNKAQFPVGTDKDGKVITGFYAARTHNIIETTTCAIQAKENDEILQIVRDFLTEYKISTYDEESHKGLVRHILTRVGYKTKEIMVCLILNGKKLPHQEELIARLTKVPYMTSIIINVNTKKTNVILGEECITLWGQSYITDYIKDVKFQISPLSFYQVNPVQTERLYSQALEYASLTGDEVVWDLYCGIGTISLFLAKSAKHVYGVEIVPQAIEDAKVNAKINGIDNATFLVGAAEDVVEDLYKKKEARADVVMVDPPRKGCAESLLDTIVSMGPKRVVYVSCDPATLARDLKYLREKGYVTETARAVDMFPNSMHVETVAVLSRKDS
ncbi:MAG: 23S rRNA (uracil(1939)-C(5))-methyltransferase RlmD [bacterium]|nr:23S rRNA (uracil(1939)-C(5))-methyltransferase RlmD [bacterium]